MARYCVNNEAQANGDHEVHKEGCNYWPYNRTDLGVFLNCMDAVRAAKRYYSQSNGYFFCARECHTG
jgi:hypothetical protein